MVIEYGTTLNLPDHADDHMNQIEKLIDCIHEIICISPMVTDTQLSRTGNISSGLATRAQTDTQTDGADNIPSSANAGGN